MTIEISVVIPAYNEAQRLEPTLRSIVAYFRARRRTTEIIVVDDGSRDQTADLVVRLARELPEIRLIRLDTNRGKGHAVRTGMLDTRGALALFADADGATPISEFGRLEAAIQAGADIAIGSRALHSDDVHVQARAHRRIIGRIFHLLVRTLTVRGLRDTQCGFKLLTDRATHDLFPRMRMDGFSFDVELLLAARRRGYKIAEIPVNWNHIPGSRVNLIFDSLRMAGDLVRIRTRALLGAYDRPPITRTAADQPASVAAESDRPAN